MFVWSDIRTDSKAVFGFSKNSSELTTIISSIAEADVLAMTETSADGANGFGNNVVWLGPLVATDIIRCHDDDGLRNITNLTRLTITRIR